MFLTSCRNEKKEAASQPVVYEKVKFEKINTPATEKIDSYFEHCYKNGTFNGVVLFADEGKIIFEKAFGYSDFRTKAPLSTNSVFQLASVSKQFTAFAIMLLKERGLIAYSDSIRKFFPSFPYQNVTIRELLTHSSGLPNYMYFADEYWPDKKKQMANSDVIEILEKNQPKEYFKPGLTYFYSNTGYAILASIVEKVSGMPFYKFMETQIFKPLGMESTFVYHPDNFPAKNIALGHFPNRREAGLNYQDGVVGDKGVYSTVEDLLRWDYALYKGRLVGKPALEEAFKPAFKKLREDHNYGFGWRINERENIVYHGGWWNGYRSYIVRSLKNHRTIIILINVASHVPFHLQDLQEFFGSKGHMELTMND